MMAVRGTGQLGYLAIDDVEFFVDFSVETCTILPAEAQPQDPTTPAPITTPEPTEPPGRKQYNLTIIFNKC